MHVWGVPVDSDIVAPMAVHIEYQMQNDGEKMEVYHENLNSSEFFCTEFGMKIEFSPPTFTIQSIILIYSIYQNVISPTDLTSGPPDYFRMTAAPQDTVSSLCATLQIRSWKTKNTEQSTKTNNTYSYLDSPPKKCADRRIQNPDGLPNVKRCIVSNARLQKAAASFTRGFNMAGRTDIDLEQLLVAASASQKLVRLQTQIHAPRSARFVGGYGSNFSMLTTCTIVDSSLGCPFVPIGEKSTIIEPEVLQRMRVPGRRIHSLKMNHCAIVTRRVVKHNVDFKRLNPPNLRRNSNTEVLITRKVSFKARSAQCLKPLDTAPCFVVQAVRVSMPSPLFTSVNLPELFKCEAFGISEVLQGCHVQKITWTGEKRERNNRPSRGELQRIPLFTRPMGALLIKIQTENSAATLNGRSSDGRSPAKYQTLSLSNELGHQSKLKKNEISFLHLYALCLCQRKEGATKIEKRNHRTKRHFPNNHRTPNPSVMGEFMQYDEAHLKATAKNRDSSSQAFSRKQTKKLNIQCSSLSLPSCQRCALYKDTANRNMHGKSAPDEKMQGRGSLNSMAKKCDLETQILREGSDKKKTPGVKTFVKDLQLGADGDLTKVLRSTFEDWLPKRMAEGNMQVRGSGCRVLTLLKVHIVGGIPTRTKMLPFKAVLWLLYLKPLAACKLKLLVPARRANERGMQRSSPNFWLRWFSGLGGPVKEHSGSLVETPSYDRQTAQQGIRPGHWL
ncbi:uncharacterized protein BDR25DRAFT_362515 [Lindgomyces ingoldianus]|uniref:Uncharacterized protein n=1 Tax=Lindgomyces ingoldianus TaxID=673940 RepID=A0ACB6Q9S8_9PLEO|nr:uncharacterized protein BDR25DRAFT_362515 [Lindgomyces ingoldianus]KAF2463713.1 hypothetical protein BDR25DRAFT_362515 [Lindgomyces ingoldianus]